MIVEFLKRIHFMDVFTGRDDETPYLTRFRLTPKTRWGQLCLHKFHRGDADRDPHDHPRDFWTFPLHLYLEQVMNPATGRLSSNYVQPYRWHYRPAEYTHIVEGRVGTYRDKPFWTLIWRKPVRKGWGFYVENGRKGHRILRKYIPWEDYLNG